MGFVTSSRRSGCFGVTLIAGSIAAAGSIPLILAFVEPTQRVVLASLATTIVLGSILFVATSRLARTADLDQAFALLKFFVILAFVAVAILTPGPSRSTYGFSLAIFLILISIPGATLYLHFRNSFTHEFFAQNIFKDPSNISRIAAPVALVAAAIFVVLGVSTGNFWNVSVSQAFMLLWLILIVPFVATQIYGALRTLCDKSERHDGSVTS
jgi:hypothetical protein